MHDYCFPGGGQIDEGEQWRRKERDSKDGEIDTEVERETKERRQRTRKEDEGGRQTA